MSYRHYPIPFNKSDQFHDDPAAFELALSCDRLADAVRRGEALEVNERVPAAGLFDWMKYRALDGRLTWGLYGGFHRFELDDNDTHIKYMLPSEVAIAAKAMKGMSLSELRRRYQSREFRRSMHKVHDDWHPSEAELIQNWDAFLVICRFIDTVAARRHALISHWLWGCVPEKR